MSGGNRFAALFDSEPAAPAAKAEAPAPTQASRGNQRAPRGGGNRGRGRGGATGGGAPTTGDTNEPLPEERRSFGGERGGQRLRDGPRGRGRGGAGRGGKDHDRHFNRTGQRDTQKRVEHGWGANKGAEEFEAEVKGETDAKADETPTPGPEATADWGEAAPSGDDPWASTPAEGAPADGAQTERPPAEEEDKTMSYEEYLKQREEQETGLPRVENLRIANDGENAFEGAVKLEGKEEGVFFQIQTEKNKSKKPHTKEKAQADESKELLNFYTPQPTRGRRGGPERERGSGRGGGGRGRGERRGSSFRGGRGRPASDAPLDLGSFPALVA